MSEPTGGQITMWARVRVSYFGWRVRRNIKYALKLRGKIRQATLGIISVRLILNETPENKSMIKGLASLEKYLKLFGDEHLRIARKILGQCKVLIDNGIDVDGFNKLDVATG